MKIKVSGIWWLGAVVVALTVGACMPAIAQSPYRLGVGLGVPYGGIGMNVEMQGSSQLAPTAGIGSMVLGGTGLGWNVGTRYYLKPSAGEKHRGSRITLLFGTNAFAKSDRSFLSLTSEYKTMTGITLGFGTQGKSWNFDLLFELPTSSVPAGYTKSTGSIDLSFGRMF